MVTKQSLQHRLTAVETQEPDRTWFEQRPARTHRLRLPTFDDLRDYGTKTTHVIAVRRGKTQVSRVPITLSGSYSLHLGIIMKRADVKEDRFLEMELAEILKASKFGRRINLEEIFFRVSSSFR